MMVWKRRLLINIYIYSHDVWYQFLKMSRLLTDVHPPHPDPIHHAFSVPNATQVARVGKTLRETISIGGDEPWIRGGCSQNLGEKGCRYLHP